MSLNGYTYKKEWSQHAKSQLHREREREREIRERERRDWKGGLSSPLSRARLYIYSTPSSFPFHQSIITSYILKFCEGCHIIKRSQKRRGVSRLVDSWEFFLGFWVYRDREKTMEGKGEMKKHQPGTSRGGADIISGNRDEAVDTNSTSVSSVFQPDARVDQFFSLSSLFWVFIWE